MRPGTKRVAIVGGTAPNNVYSEQVFRKGLKPYLEKIELIDLTKLSMEETLTRVGSLPPDTIVLYAAISSDGKGRSFVPREALSTFPGPPMRRCSASMTRSWATASSAGGW